MRACGSVSVSVSTGLTEMGSSLQLFLSIRTQFLDREIAKLDDALRENPDILVYLGELCDLLFSCIIQTSEEFRTLFSDKALISSLISVLSRSCCSPHTLHLSERRSACFCATALLLYCWFRLVFVAVAACVRSEGCRVSRCVQWMDLTVNGCEVFNLEYTLRLGQSVARWSFHVNVPSSVTSTYR